MTRHPTHNPAGTGRDGFTLTELLVVMAIIAVLSVVTLVSIRAIARDARLASATNTVMASLNNARALAMKDNTLVLVVFKPRRAGDRDVAVDVVTCQWSGETYAGNAHYIDRFVPIPDVPIRDLPVGIKVAAPNYAGGVDDVWLTQAQLPLTEAGAEVAGAMLGIMYAPDGSTLTGNPKSDSTTIWPDFKVHTPGAAPQVHMAGTDVDPTMPAVDGFFRQTSEDDETFVTFAPFLAIYNDEEARGHKVGDWSVQADFEADLTGPFGYISQYADRIHFNRYSGVALR